MVNRSNDRANVILVHTSPFVVGRFPRWTFVFILTKSTWSALFSANTTSFLGSSLTVRPRSTSRMLLHSWNLWADKKLGVGILSAGTLLHGSSIWRYAAGRRVRGWCLWDGLDKITGHFPCSISSYDAKYILGDTCFLSTSVGVWEIVWHILWNRRGPPPYMWLETVMSISTNYHHHGSHSEDYHWHAKLASA